MSDLLSSASLFLAVLGLLYSAWYGEITEALSKKKPLHKPDRGPIINIVQDAYYSRGMPLAVGSFLITIILLPDLFFIIAEVWNTWENLGAGAFGKYDAVKTLFCAVWLITFGLTFHTITLTVHLRIRLMDLRKD